MIEVKNLTKIYGDHTAVDGLSFKINNGKIYGLLGPNGAGKSTTMNMMTGCLAPTSGSVKINGFDMFDEPLRAKKCIGYLPEIPPVYGEMTPLEYLRFVADAKGVPYNRAIRQVQEAMELTHIEDMKNRLIKNLSKGYRQRVGIAQAMLGNPDIIILDEPTVGLDPKQIAEIRELIRTLGEIKTVIVSSHILAEIQELCDHVLIISGGKLIANAPIEELQNRTGDRLRLRLSVRGDERGVLKVLSSFDEIEGCTVTGSREDGVINLTLSAAASDDLRDRIFFAMADSRYAVLSMEKEEETLESIFLQLTDETPTSARAAENDRDGEYELIDDRKEDRR
ncbi:MAG: ABC transporter ATP-binding protein [Clostridia bacterium]|nr:ABC transporter ATP-binding protein [Clostridia bacterium]